MPNRSPLRIAFVGTGIMARNHLGALSHVPTEHAVTGVFDTNATAAAAFAEQAGPQATVYPTLATLLAESKPDVVHICTPAGTHFEPARQALLAGAHLYVEKPFVETRAEADELFQLARERNLLICAGHQLMRDPAFEKLLLRAAELGSITLVDSHFAFRSPTLSLHRASQRALAGQLLDVLPHPLYTLLAAMERVAAGPSHPEVVAVAATPVELHALLRQGTVFGRLFISLRARPVASTLALTGSGGTLTADFVSGMLLGTGNDGTSPLEKVGNPFLQGMQLLWQNAASLARRLRIGIDADAIEHRPGLFSHRDLQPVTRPVGNPAEFAAKRLPADQVRAGLDLKLGIDRRLARAGHCRGPRQLEPLARRLDRQRAGFSSKRMGPGEGGETDDK